MQYNCLPRGFAAGIITGSKYLVAGVAGNMRGGSVARDLKSKGVKGPDFLY